MTKNKRSKLALISLILGAAYLIYIISYFFNASTSTTDTAEAVGIGLAATIILPHMIATLIAVIMNTIGYLMNMRGFILTGAILYTVAIVLFPVYIMFVIIQAVLSYVAFGKMKKAN